MFLYWCTDLVILLTITCNAHGACPMVICMYSLIIRGIFFSRLAGVMWMLTAGGSPSFGLMRHSTFMVVMFIPFGSECYGFFMIL